MIDKATANATYTHAPVLCCAVWLTLGLSSYLLSQSCPHDSHASGHCLHRHRAVLRALLAPSRSFMPGSDMNNAFSLQQQQQYSSSSSSSAGGG